jgi:nitrogen-specific signal transduction histidine kinase
MVDMTVDRDKRRVPPAPDFKGLRHSKIGYFKEFRSKIKELETLNVQLARRHNRLDAIFNSMSDGVTILDRNLNIVFTNRIQKTMFPEISNTVMRCHQIFYQRDRRCPDCPVMKTLKTGEMLRGEHMFKRGHLAGRYAEWTTSPIADAFGRVDEIILIMRDITERKEYELKLMQTDRMVSVGFLAASLAHEINNPLTSIAGFSEGLLKRLKTMAPTQGERVLASFRDYLEIINSEAYRCKDIIQNLREFSSNASDGNQSLPIDRIIQETLSLIRQHAKDNQITIVFENHLASGLNQLVGKSGHLKHLFLNLFKQLFNTLSAGQQLKITARNDGEIINVVLSDPDGSLSRELSECPSSQSMDGCFSKGPERMDLSICCDIIRSHKGDIGSLPATDGGRLLVLRFPAVLT